MWVDARLRWLHANKPEWNKILERQNNKDRDFVITFAEHWAKAFIANPEKFKTKFPIME